MAQVDIAALLAQLTQANLALNQIYIDRDARAAASAAARVREDTIRGQVSKIDRCTGEEKPKLWRWLRDITTLNATHLDVAIAVAERTSRDNLADTSRYSWRMRATPHGRA